MAVDNSLGSFLVSYPNYTVDKYNRLSKKASAWIQNQKQRNTSNFYKELEAKVVYMLIY